MDGSSSLLALTDLSATDLTDLRLAAQIMAHRAALADRPRVAMYFESLEAAVMAEQAARGQASAFAVEGPISQAGDQATLLLTAASPADTDLLNECLSLLA